MSRGLAYFIGFCIVVGIGGLTAALWVGWDLARFVVDSERRSAPLTVLRLERVRAGEDLAAYREAIVAPTLRMFEAQGGATAARGTTRLVVHGTVNDEWDFVTLHQWPTGKAFVDVVTSPEYRQLDETSVDQRADLARFVVEDPWQRPLQRGVVIFLLSSSEGQSLEGLRHLTSVVSRYDGERIWSSRLSPLSSDDDRAWTMAVGYVFPSEKLLAEWLDDPERMTDATLASTRLDRFALLVVDPI